MTEVEWLACNEPSRLLSSLFSRGRKDAASDERFRRFGIACCRRVAEVLEFGDTYALDCLEIYATSKLREAILKARRFHRPAGNDASRAMTEAYKAETVTKFRAEARLLATSAVWTCTKTKPTQAAMAHREAALAKAHLTAAGEPDRPVRRHGGWLPPNPAELAIQAALLRDIFHSPFRSVEFSPDWRTDTVVALARQMYESRDFSAMPVLADALQDAGCDNDDIFAHCRERDATHVRGCWVVDLVLGKR
jgi:hypothetical protein